MIFHRILKLCILFFSFCIAFPLITQGGIRDTKHNLSVTGQGAIKAVEEKQICIFCHTPHNANPAYPLWNHEVSAVTTYTHYVSNTLQSYSSEAEAPPIDGVSKLCLSCHDGTVAVGSVMSRTEEILMAISDCVDSSGKLVDVDGCTGYIGTDLSGGHPISIVYDETLVGKRNDPYNNLSKLNWPINDPYVKLYPTQGRLGVQCSSCHDPHTTRSSEPDPEDPTKTWPPFWQKSTFNEVCIVCHQEIPPNYEGFEW